MRATEDRTGPGGPRRAAAWLALVLAGPPLLAFGQDPFSVTASMEQTPTGRQVAVSFAIPAGHYLYADRLKVQGDGELDLVPLRAPLPRQKPDPLTGEPVSVFDRGFSLAFGVRGAVPTEPRIRVAYQGCNPSLCFMPQRKTLSLGPAAPAPEPRPPPAAVPPPAPPVEPTPGWRAMADGFDVLGTAAGYLPARAFLEFLRRAEAGIGDETRAIQDAFARHGVWLAVLLILAGGVALNFTPCVLPMIPVNLAIIGAGVKAGSRSRGFFLGGAYGAGIALAYGALGAVAVVSGARFGTLNSTPAFNLAAGALFLVLALAMFGVFNLDFSRFLSAGSPNANPRRPFVTAFAFGLVAAVLAGACVAPVLISVLLLAADLHARGNPAGLALPFLLGIGMALPWPLAGAGLASLPKPGGWMGKVKVVFAVAILLLSFWYLRLGVALAREGGSPGPAEAALDHGEWRTDLEAAMAEASKERRLLLIDFWASWCKNCLRMDRVTFRSPRVVDRLKPYVKVKFRADDLSDPAARAVLDHFHVLGLPTYAILRPKDGRTDAPTARAPRRQPSDEPRR